MAFLLNLFKAKPTAPERVPTDTIISLNRHDDTRTNRSVSLEYTMRFDDVLDADKLADALWRLLEKPGWKKLGARLRLNSSNKLEYHVPAQYTKQRPPINYTHATHDISIRQHPLGAKLPRANGKLQVHSQLMSLSGLAVPEENTRKLADWIYTDKAQLSLHITNFADATLVSLTWLHSLLDAMGRHALLKAWIAILEGRDTDVPEFWGYDFDPLSKLGAVTNDTAAANSDHDFPDEEFVLAPKVIKRWQLLRFIIAYIYELVFHPHEQSYTICIPDPSFSRIRHSALADLTTAPASLLTPSTHNPSTPFLSDGDILLAWLTRLLARTNTTILHSPPTRRILIMNLFGMRDLLTRTAPPLLPEGVAYTANCASVIATLLTVQDVLGLPLGHLAARLRRDISVQGTRAQVEALQRLIRKGGGGMPLFGPEGDVALFVFTNWVKARLFEMDFEGAVVGVREGKEGVREGKEGVREGRKGCARGRKGCARGRIKRGRSGREAGQHIST